MKQEQFQQRRQRLMQLMGKGLAIIPAAPTRIRNNDVDFPYRSDSDFYYLTGFAEPEAVAVIIPDGIEITEETEEDGGEEQSIEAKYIMFCRQRDAKMEQWDGKRAGLEGVVSDYGVDKAYPIEQLKKELPKLLQQVDSVFYALGSHELLDQQLPKWLKQVRAKARSGKKGPESIVMLDELVHEMRLFKSDVELDSLRRSAQIAAEAHCQLMRDCAAGVYEYQLQAEFLYQCAMRGARQASYTAIVAGGANACILHYVENNDVLKDGDLVLIDAGCEVDLYASDITRTFPVNGKFSQSQRQIYQLVLDAQLAAIAEVKPGNPWDQPHQAVLRVLTQGLMDLGILNGELESLIEEEAFKPFFMHKTGHWLGLDVHDVGAYKIDEQWRKLLPGMVMTIEPGLYIPEGMEAVDEKWWGIGIRIEDDVLVTSGGCEVLTAAVPKSIQEIEALMA